MNVHELNKNKLVGQIFCNRFEKGCFSLLSETFIRLFGRFEHEGYTLPPRALTGKEM
jgi:hypothetical protein